VGQKPAICRNFEAKEGKQALREGIRFERPSKRLYLQKSTDFPKKPHRCPLTQFSQSAHNRFTKRP
jgi:hypothetical protein